MKRFKVLGLALLAVFAFAAVLSASASALPQLLGWEETPTYSGENTAPKPKLETNKKETITCASATASGTQSSDTAGTFDIHFKTCESSGFKCNTAGDETGIILAKGTFSYVFDALGAELGVAILFEPEEQTIKCTALVTLHVKGTLLCPVSSPLTSSTTHNFSCSETAGVPAQTLYWDDEGLEHHAQALTQKNGGTFIESGEQAEASVTFASAVAFMNE